MSKRSSMAKAKHQVGEGLKPPSTGHTLRQAVEPPAPPTPAVSPRRRDFPMLVANPGLHYLDSAATSQKPRAVLDAIRSFYEKDNANPHRGAYDLSARSTQKYLDARERVADFLGVVDTSTLIFTRGTTESLNLVASAWGRTNLGKGDEVIITGMEHHANFGPWQQVA